MVSGERFQAYPARPKQVKMAGGCDSVAVPLRSGSLIAIDVTPDMARAYTLVRPTRGATVWVV